MRLLLAAALAVAGVGVAQEPSSPTPPPAAPAAAAPATVHPHVGTKGVFSLANGGRLAGTLVESGADGDVVELDSGQRIRLAPGSIVGVSAPLVGPGTREPPRGAVRIMLRSGLAYDGKVLPSVPGRVRLERLDGGGVLDVEEDEIAQRRDLDELRADRGGPVDPARGRYLAIPAALPLSLGDLRLAATLAEPLSATFGLGLGLEATAAATAPLFAGSTSSPGLAADVSWNVSLLPWLHAGGGVRWLRESSGGVSGVAHGSVTFGNASTHGTFYAGPPLPGAPWLGGYEAVVLGAAGTWRLLPRLAVLGEAWIGPGDVPQRTFAAGGARWLPGYGLALDAGVLVSPRLSLSPWLGVTWSPARRTP